MTGNIYKSMVDLQNIANYLDNHTENEYDELLVNQLITLTSKLADLYIKKQES